MCPRRTFNEILRLGGVIDGERPPVEAQGVPVALEPPLDDGSSRLSASAAITQMMATSSSPAGRTTIAS